MNSKIRSFAWLPVLFAILACSTFIPLPQLELKHVQITDSYSKKPTSTPTSTSTIVPSATPSPTLIIPSSTPTQISTATPVATPLTVNTQLRIFENLWFIVNNTYVYPDFNGLDWNAINQEYRQIIASGLTNDQFYLAMSDVITRLGDDHSFFLDPQQVAKLEAKLMGEYDYVGIGALVSAVPERERAVILAVISGSPAEEAGLQPRDNILSVDGIPILNDDGFLQDIVRGPEGTTITIVVQSPGEDLREIRLKRHRIIGDLPIVYTVINSTDGMRIGYILLVSFEDSTIDDQVAAALGQMNADGPLDGLILDIRMNGGGSSTVLEPVLGYLIGGNMGHFVNHLEERPLEITLNDINGSSQVPLVVLVGSGTASFGEIFAGVLQDTGRAYLIGTTTDGNVEILWGFNLEDGSQLWLAKETFRPLNHPDQDWEKTGIIPDLYVSGEFDQYTLDNDPAVLAAIQYFSEH